MLYNTKCGFLTTFYCWCMAKGHNHIVEFDKFTVFSDKMHQRKEKIFQRGKHGVEWRVRVWLFSCLAYCMSRSV